MEDAVNSARHEGEEAEDTLQESSDEGSGDEIQPEEHGQATREGPEEEASQEEMEASSLETGLRDSSRHNSSTEEPSVTASTPRRSAADIASAMRAMETLLIAPIVNEIEAQRSQSELDPIEEGSEDEEGSDDSDLTLEDRMAVIEGAFGWLLGARPFLEEMVGVIPLGFSNFVEGLENQFVVVSSRSDKLDSELYADRVRANEMDDAYITELQKIKREYGELLARVRRAEEHADEILGTVQGIKEYLEALESRVVKNEGDFDLHRKDLQIRIREIYDRLDQLQEAVDGASDEDEPSVIKTAVGGQLHMKAGQRKSKDEASVKDSSRVISVLQKPSGKAFPSFPKSVKKTDQPGSKPSSKVMQIGEIFVSHDGKGKKKDGGDSDESDDERRKLKKTKKSKKREPSSSSEQSEQEEDDEPSVKRTSDKDRGRTPYSRESLTVKGGTTTGNIKGVKPLPSLAPSALDTRQKKAGFSSATKVYSVERTEGEVHDIPARDRDSSKQRKKDGSRFPKRKGGAVTLSGTRPSEPPAASKKPIEKGERKSGNRESSSAAYSGQSKVSHQRKGKSGHPKPDDEEPHVTGCRCGPCQETF